MVKIFLKRYWMLVVITLFLLLSMIGFPFIVKIPILLYALYRGIKLIGHSGCPTCIYKFLIAIALAIMVLISLPTKTYLIAIAILWVKPTIDALTKDNKDSPTHH